MITCNPIKQETLSIVVDNDRPFVRINDLLDYLELPQQDEVDTGFPFLVSRHFASLMAKGNPNDPLLLQVLPVAAEKEPSPGFCLDPLADCDAHQGQGILQKYHGRALLVATGACAIHCRYCFRRHFPYTSHSLGNSQIDDVLSTLAERPDLSEIILSGGDPLTLSTDKLSRLISGLRSISHVKRIRLHSRAPVARPSLLNDNLCRLLAPVAGCPTVLVLHINHPREIAPQLADKVAKLRKDGVLLLNQAVLLKGVNDSAGCQALLAEALFEHGILPYYLHQLDKVQGAAHFQVDDAAARELYAELRSLLPGYLLPRFVVESPGASSKIPVM